jgi:2-polyprenyl-3-methyl-5-hydroxy-6-metoxy-1,4-benzoquinol methylase
MSSAEGPAYYYRFAGLYEKHLSIPPFAGWVKANHSTMFAELPSLEGGKILEIGGGIGRLSRRLAERFPSCEVTSIDSAADMTARAQRRPGPENLHFLTRSFWEMEGQFDLVVCAGVWEFFQLDPSVVRLVSLMAPQATALINTLAPAGFGLARELLFQRVWRGDMWLHRPELLASELSERGCEVTWRRVNRFEGSYTLKARLR